MSPKTADPRTILHVDLDAFFASVEQVLDPSLRGRPVVVGGRPDDRSVVASASYEARACGVKTGMPIAQAHRVCPQAVFLRGTFAHYRQASQRVFAICGEFSPVVEPASIDEGYIDLTGCDRLWRRGPAGGDVPAAGRSAGTSDASADWAMAAAVQLRRRVLDQTGLRVSIGVGTNKLISRVATDLAKPNGICRVRPGSEAAFLAPMPIEVIPGIGHRTAERLTRAGVRTVAELRQAPAALLEARFGVVGRELAERAAGRDDRAVIPGGSARKSISRESSFERDLADRGPALAMLYYLTERAAWSLRGEHLVCGRVAVKLRYGDFATRVASATLAEVSDRDEQLFAAASGLFSRLDQCRKPIRLVGVCLEQLRRLDGRQMGLFDESAGQRRSRLHRVQDAIRERFGFASLTTGRSIELLTEFDRDANGFKLRTSCLTK